MKAALKAMMNGLMLLLVTPLLLLYYLCWPLLGSEQSFQMMSQLLSLAPGMPGNYLRRAFYRMTIRHCGRDVCISFGTIFSKRDVTLADGVYIGAYCHLGLVTIGENTLLADNVAVPSGTKQHCFDDPDVPIKEQGGTFQRVTIGADCWIGACTVVLADVGDHAVVAAGSVVSRPLSAWGLARGAPARVIKSRKPQGAASAESQPGQADPAASSTTRDQKPIEEPLETAS